MRLPYVRTPRFTRIEYEALVETLDVLSDADAMAALRQGLREVRAGKAIPWEQAKRKLGL